jgi:2-succinyl-5-enolpyruvyl-6-hydroxy-3-cyclohexene-1-carboxylate synthase
VTAARLAPRPADAARRLTRRPRRRTRAPCIVAGRSERDPGSARARRLRRTRSRCRCWPSRSSGARRGPAAVAHYDALLRDPAGRAHSPDLVLRVGDLPTSKPLRQWLHGSTARSRSPSTRERLAGPGRRVATIVGADPRVLAPDERGAARRAAG